MTTIALDDYRKAMRENICGVCVSFTRDKGNPTRCAHEVSAQCSLFAHLGKVVDAVSAVESGSIEPYLTVLRQEVCAQCTHQDERGICDLRDSRRLAPAWCALDTYFNLIVGTIEEVRGRN